MSKAELVVKASSYSDDFLRVCKNVLDDAFKKGGEAILDTHQMFGRDHGNV